MKSVSGLKTQDVESQRITFDLPNKIYAKMSLLTLTLTILLRHIELKVYLLVKLEDSVPQKKTAEAHNAKAQNHPRKSRYCW